MVTAKALSNKTSFVEGKTLIQGVDTPAKIS